MSDIETSASPPDPAVPAVVDIPAVPDPSVEACKRDRMKLILSLSAMGYLALVTIIDAMIIFRHIQVDGGAAATMNLLAGAATGYVKDAFSYVFGSSQGSEDKNTQISTLQAAAVKNG